MGVVAVVCVRGPQYIMSFLSRLSRVAARPNMATPMISAPFMQLNRYFSSDRGAGHVKYFNSKRGYGFIIPEGAEEGDPDIFVHHSDIQMDGFRSLADGEAVEFDISEDDQGRRTARSRAERRTRRRTTRLIGNIKCSLRAGAAC